MKLLFAMLAAIFCTAAIAAETSPPEEAGSKLPAPDDPGMKTPVDPGAVVKPPRTGSEEMVKVPKRIDPEIDDATPGVDRQNRRKLEEKKEKKEKTK